jgi:hypothetical protein
MHIWRGSSPLNPPFALDVTLNLKPQNMPFSTTTITMMHVTHYERKPTILPSPCVAFCLSLNPFHIPLNSLNPLNVFTHFFDYPSFHSTVPSPSLIEPLSDAHPCLVGSSVCTPATPYHVSYDLTSCTSIFRTMYIVYIGGKPPKVTINMIDDDDDPDHK